MPRKMTPKSSKSNKATKKESKETLKSVIGSFKSFKSNESHHSGNSQSSNGDVETPEINTKPEFLESKKHNPNAHSEAIKDSTFSIIEASQDSLKNEVGSVEEPNEKSIKEPSNQMFEDLKEHSEHSSFDLSQRDSAFEEEKQTESKKKVTNNHPVALYRMLLLQRSKIKQASEIMSGSTYATLSSIGYGSLLLSYMASKAATQTTLNLTKLSAQLKSLSSLSSDWRTFYRVWGTMGTVEWAIDLFENPHQDTIIKYCDYIQAIAGVVYQSLEDLAYLASKNVINISGQTQNKLWIISCYFWATHVFVEFAKLARSPRTDDWHKRLLVNFAWLPLTIHWSTEKGFLNDGQVGLLGSIAYMPTAIDNWRGFFKC